MNILRRSFLLAPLAGLFPKLIQAKPVVLQSEYGLGKYLSHYIISNHQYDWLDIDEGKEVVTHRYLAFPIEATLIIEFEKGTETYTGFNAKKEVTQLINTIGYQKLLEYQIKDGTSDNYSTRFDFSKDNYKFKMFLSSISYDNKVPCMHTGEFVIHKYIGK